MLAEGAVWLVVDLQVVVVVDALGHVVLVDALMVGGVLMVVMGLLILVVDGWWRRYEQWWLIIELKQNLIVMFIKAVHLL